MSCLGTSHPFYSSQISCSFASPKSLPTTTMIGFSGQQPESTPGASMAPAPGTLYTEESRCFEGVPNQKVDRKAEERCPSFHLCLPALILNGY